MVGIVIQEILIHLQSMIGCLEFLIDHPNIWHNQTYELSCVYNEIEHLVYNEIYIGD